MPFAAAAAGISAAAGIGSAVIGANASHKAASQQEAAANAAMAQQQGQFNTTRADLAPYRDAGTGGLNQLMALLGLGPGGAGGAQSTLAATPGYQFTRDQGLDALQNSLAARGGAMGGNAMKAIMGYGSGLANQTYQQAVGNASGLAGLGENAATRTGQFGAGNADAITSLLTGQGNAAAAGTIGGASALAGGLNGVGQSGMNYAMLLQLLNAGGGSTGYPSSLPQSLLTGNPGSSYSQPFTSPYSSTPGQIY